MAAHSPKILVTAPLAPGLLGQELGHIVEHAPGILAGDGARAGDELLARAADVVITRRGAFSAEMLARWCVDDDRPRLVVITDGERAWPEVRAPRVHVVAVPGPEGSATQAALAAAERWLARRRERAGRTPSPAAHIRGQEIALVGAGVVNLLTALELVEHGARVAVYDARPDPRDTCDWRLLGCTHGGANGRVFCVTETECHQARAAKDSAYARAVLRRTVAADGWLLTPYERLGPDERAWIERFERVPGWRAQVFAEDVRAINTASAIEWARLERQFPELFAGVDLKRGVVRLYTEREALEAAGELHGRLGVLRSFLEAEELARRYPTLCDAVARGALAGGLEIAGFSLSVHGFCARLMAHLEARGVRFHWQHPVIGLVRAREPSRAVLGLETRAGPVRAQHYVLSPGAYGEELLAGTRSAGKVMGVLGLWMFLPNLGPRLEVSLKLHRPGHVGEDANIIPSTDGHGRPRLIVGSGYAFVGHEAAQRERRMAAPELVALEDAVRTACRRVLPRAYERAVRADTLLGERQSCVRPYTATGLGVFERLATAEGGQLIIATGHNTGGFTQAPSVASAVRASLCGEDADMAALFDPERGCEPLD